MKRFLVVILVMITIITIFISQTFAQEMLKLETPFSGAMGTASAVGGWYVIGGGICNVVSKHVEGLTLTPQVTGGSVDNVRLLSNKEVELIELGAGVAYQAIRGLPPFTEKYENLNVLFSFGGTVVHLVTRKDSGIKSIGDLSGKKVAIGPPGSGTEAMSRIVFEAANLEGKVKTLPMGFEDMYDALRDKNIDAFFLEATPPGPALEELARTTKINLVKFDEEILDAITVSGAYVKGRIRANTYTGIEEDIPTPFSPSFIMCLSGLSEDLAYNIVKATFMNLEEIRVVHAGAKAINLEDAITGAPYPVHPGAMKYYKEVGLVK